MSAVTREMMEKMWRRKDEAIAVLLCHAALFAIQHAAPLFSRVEP